VTAEPEVAADAGRPGKIRRRFDWDVMVGVTDLPIRFEGRTLVVEVADAQPIALVSLPALGAVNIHRRVSATVADLAWSMHGLEPPGPDGACWQEWNAIAASRPQTMISRASTGTEQRVAACSLKQAATFDL
jgi:hypothetical protein